MKTLTERIEAIEAAITKERECMDAILKDNGVEIAEDITDEDEKECWDSAHKSARYLEGQLKRIESCLHSAEQHMFVNCG